jgi:hypothetical protein
MKKIFSAGGLAFLLALAAFSARPAAAQTEITKIDWELSRLQGKTRVPFAPVTELRADTEQKFTDKLLAVVTLRNDSAKDVEGLVLRYSLRLRLQKAGDPVEKAFWAVPFYFEEVRVSVVKAKAERQARVINFQFQDQLRKLRSSGFVPTALKMEIMLCPRQGDDPAAIIREAVIEILKPS